MNTHPNRVAIYTRVSTQEQASEGYSIGEQHSRLEKYAEAHDWTVYKWYNDPGYSGGSLDRPGLQSMLRDAEAGLLNKIIVYKLDRLSRSQKDTLFLIEDVFIKNNVDFVSMTENFDTGSPLGRAMIGILSVFAQLEREQIKERMQIGLDARAKEGYFHGGPYAPIGYNYTDGQLIVDEHEAMQVRKIYELFLDGMPIYSIQKYMNHHYGGNKYGKWSADSVRSCLSTIACTGKIKWKGEVYPGRHEAIIDDETFEKAAKILERRSQEAQFREHPFKRTTLLGGILWCGNCGARYYCKQNVSKNPGSTPAQRYYTCYSRGKTQRHLIKDPNCKNKTWNVKALDEVILQEIEKLAFTPDYLDELMGVREEVPANRPEAEIIGKRIESLGKQIGRLMDLYALDQMDFETLNGRIAKLSEEKNVLEAELARMVERPKPDLSIEEARRMIADIPRILEESDPEAVKNLVHGLIKGIIVYDERLEIHWSFM